MHFSGVYLVVLVLVQVNAEPVPESNLGNSGKEIVDKGLTLILSGLNYTIDYIQEFDAKYVNNKSQVNEEEVEELLNRGHQIFNFTVNILNSLFDSIENEAGILGKKSIKCVRQEENKAREALDEILTDYANCINVHIPDIILSYQDALKALIQTRDILSKAQIRLEKCVLADLCLVQFLQDCKDLPASLTNIVKASPPIIKILKEVFLTDTPNCVKNEATDIGQRVLGLVEDVVNCVEH